MKPNRRAEALRRPKALVAAVFRQPALATTAFRPAPEGALQLHWYGTAEAVP